MIKNLKNNINRIPLLVGHVELQIFPWPLVSPL